MVLTFSHEVDGQRTPLLDTEGREVSFNIEALNKSDAIRSEAVGTFIDGLTGKQDVRVRGVT